MALMQTENATQTHKRIDVRWLDEVALHGAVVSGDQEAFAELRRRFDPVLRARLLRFTPEAEIDGELARFWCTWVQDGFARLRGWEPSLGCLLGQWIVVLAAQASPMNVPLRRQAVG